VALVQRADAELDLARYVVVAMTCNDSSLDVLRRGSRVLGALAHAGERLVARLLAARAPPVLLGVLESFATSREREARELCLYAVSVLLLLKSPLVCAAAREARGAELLATLFRIASENGEGGEGSDAPARNADFCTVLFDLSSALAEDAELAVDLAARLAPTAARVLALAARGSSTAFDARDVQKLTLVTAALGFLRVTLRRGGSSAATPLLDVKMHMATASIIDAVLSTAAHGAGGGLLQKWPRSMVRACADVLDAFCAGGGAASALARDADVGATLERAAKAYTAVPDQTQGGALVVDATTLLRVATPLRALIADGGYRLTDPKVLASAPVDEAAIRSAGVRPPGPPNSRGGGGGGGASEAAPQQQRALPGSAPIPPKPPARASSAARTAALADNPDVVSLSAGRGLDLRFADGTLRRVVVAVDAPSYLNLLFKGSRTGGHDSVLLCTLPLEKVTNMHTKEVAVKKGGGLGALFGGGKEKATKKQLIVEGDAKFSNANGIVFPIVIEMDSETELRSFASALSALGVKPGGGS
jgi:hypothetical protein